jgi:hypothetical protein
VLFIDNAKKIWIKRSGPMHRGGRQGDLRSRTVVVFKVLPDLGKGAVTDLGSTNLRVQLKV